MPTPVILWDKDHKLVMANKETKLKEKKYGKKFKVGTSRLEFVKHALKKGFVKAPKGITQNEFLKQRQKEFLDPKYLSGKRTIDNIYGDGSIYLVSTSNLSNGGTLQFFTDVTEIKENEKSLKRLSDAIELTPSQIYLWNKKDELIMVTLCPSFSNSSANSIARIGLKLPLSMCKGSPVWKIQMCKI